MRVIIESPYAGKTDYNRVYLIECLMDSLRRGESPFASHGFYTNFLDDHDPVERQMGMEAGFDWMQVAEKVVVYEDLGISSGMREGISRAAEYGIAVEFRSLYAG